MKKIYLIAIIIILLGLAGYVFVAKKPLKRGSVEPAPQKAVETPTQPTPAATIDTNDNLDEALKDLDQIE